MDREDLRTLVRERPFKPIAIAISDGRTVLIRHPDQVVITKRKVIFGIAQVRRTRGDFSTPAADVVAKDWLMVDLLHVVSAEPINDKPRKAGARERRPRKQ